MDHWYQFVLYPHKAPNYWQVYLSLICPDFYFCCHESVENYSPAHYHIAVHFPFHFDFAAICALLAPLKVPVPNGVTLIHNFDDFKSYCERGAL